jgi:hypothetical protein
VKDAALLTVVCLSTRYRNQLSLADALFRFNARPLAEFAKDLSFCVREFHESHFT